ncbi:hypothetical protein ACSFE6_29590 [Pseudomonas baetica]
MAVAVVVVVAVEVVAVEVAVEEMEVVGGQEVLAVEAPVVAGQCNSARI